MVKVSRLYHGLRFCIPKDVRLGTSQTCMIELFCENSCRLFLPVIVTGQLLFLQESYIIDV